MAALAVLIAENPEPIFGPPDFFSMKKVRKCRYENFHSVVPDVDVIFFVSIMGRDCLLDYAKLFIHEQNDNFGVKMVVRGKALEGNIAQRFYRKDSVARMELTQASA